MNNTISPGTHFFSVMSLNIRFGHAEDGPNNWIHRQDSITSLLSAFVYDFYAFQEANDSQINYLSNILPNYKYIGQRNPAPKRWQNNVMFYHKSWLCIYYKHFYLSSSPNKPSKFRKSLWPRQCTLGIFKNGDQSLIIVTTHFDFEDVVQVKSAQLIRKRLRRHTGKGPIVLMGDFNATSDSECYLEFTSKLDGYPKFSNAFKTSCIGTNHGFTGKSKIKAVDWILYSGDLKVENTKVITNKFLDRYPSDHFPLIATFELQ
ncbi:MAG: endonuclease/exonuclease/phosphatase family protein [Proteobacteria bacterium]|nr:endonuclease/exonuclease/phosphatase family protein [Pseudomonadota bacterium]MBU4035967.1 endonuclease/exonuclease/phosphatase family protein [Pseudomonadota bacterium]